MTVALIDWLRHKCAQFDFSPAGVFQTDGEHDWPMVAADVDDLVTQLDAGGFLTRLLQ